MIKKLLCFIMAASMIIPVTANISCGAEETETTPRIMENLDRGLIAAKVPDGVYLSWRLLGTESLENQAFDIYRNNVKIHTTGVHDATCYTDKSGTAADTYKVVRAGTTATEEPETAVWTNMIYNSVTTGNLPYVNRLTYKDLLFDAPEGGTVNGSEYTYTANDMSVGDLDGDGQYELIVKWDPTNSQDNSNSGYTGNVIIDAYEMNEVDADGKAVRLWRLDLGRNIRAGAHYTQYLVYDFDCDGKSEIIFKTAPNSKDANGDYVSKVGKGITVADDETADYRNSSGRVITGEEYLTIFNGETGAAMQTVPYEPPRTIVPMTSSGWGDDYGNRSERYLAGVAYLDGVRPSAIFTRGYYTYAYAAAYSWDGKNLNLQWLSKNDKSSCTVEYANGTTKTQSGKTLYGQGAHSVSVADVDNDGCDELIFGSAVLDNDGTVLMYDNRGHGDAEHVSDFDNDGKQEIFFVHEAGKGKSDTVDFAVDIKRYDANAETGAYDVMLQPAVGDIGRGVMANVDDEYAYDNKSDSKNLAAFWSTASASDIFNENGEAIGNIPNSNSNLFENMFIYWDGDLGRELIDGTMLAKHSIKNNTTARLEFAQSNGSMFPNVSSNNGTKANPGLVADILGDWREEVIYRLWDGTGVRIYMSAIPTEYRLTTLMHDSQYRVAVAWQNVGYNQPAHQSYYIGSAALATDENGALLNYLDPAAPFTVMTYPGEEELPAPVPPSKTTNNVIYEKGTNADTAWSTDDILDWVLSNTSPDLVIDADILKYNANTNSSYNASKTFAVSDNARIITYDIDWNFGDQPSVVNQGKVKSANYEYIQFGSNLRFGWGGGSYNLYLSTDAGSSYSDTALMSGKGRYTKNITIEIDLDTNQINSISFDGNELSDYKGTSVSNPTELSFGLQRASSVTSWNVASGIDGIKVTEKVAGADITGITASTTKTTYKEGDAFDKSTVSVTAHYSDGTDEELTPYYFSVTGYDKNVTGNQTLTVHVGDITDTINIYVEPKRLTGITLGGSYKTQYKEGEELDLSGLTVTAVYDNGTEGAVADYTVSGYNKNVTGNQTLTVHVGDITDTITVYVEPKQLTDLTLGGSYKTRYNYGEELNLTGMTVTANYDIGTSETVTDYTVSGYDKSKVGSQTITVSYGGKMAQLTVTVVRTDVYIDASKNGTTVTAELKNYTGSAQLILAVYDGTRLKSVDIKDAGGAVSFTNVTIPTGGKYRIYAWNSAAGVKPLCAVYE